jgi:activating signal cointegrator 1
MKAISLLQPWATLVVIGAKKIETRSWNTKYRGPLLIHASKKMGALQKALCEQTPFADALKDVEELPLGKIIGTVQLRTTFISEMVDMKDAEGIFYQKWGARFTDQEKAFGDYSSGRWGWLFSDPISFEHHYPIKGSLSIWNFDERICTKCGCTENDACNNSYFGPCWWVGPSLCSHCQMKEQHGSIDAFKSSLKQILR